MGGSEVSGGILSGAKPLQDGIALFLLQVVIITAATRLLAYGLSYLKQPRVIAEVLAGIILGPSVMGYVPGWMDTIFPHKSLPYLTLAANIGLILYMFLVGLELNPTTLFKNARHTVAISATGILFPFALGAMASFVLYQQQMKDPAQAPVPFSSFLLFTGVAMSITAFPVLARILTDLNLVGTDVGVLTIGSAAIDDAVAWCMLILVISILNSSSMIAALWVFMLVAGYGLVLLVVARPWISRYLDKLSTMESEMVQTSVLAATFMAIFLSAFFTEIAGVHTIFGAFLLGLAVPSHNPTALRLAKTIEDFASIVLLPLYFAASGLRTQISSLNSPAAAWMLLLIVVISTVGKFLGCALAARAVSVPWREAFTIGTLMNTRGLVELIVLNLGLDAKVIDVQLFTTMVLMALITTFATSPVVSFIYPPHLRRPATVTKPETPVHADIELPHGFRLMVVAQRMGDVPGLALLVQLIRPDVLSAVRFVESENTPISIIMAQGTGAAVRLDPTLQMMNTCGYLAGVPVEANLKVCKSEDFATELCERAAAESANMVIVPCRKKVRFIRDYHNAFLSETVDKCKQTLLLFWDQELGPQVMTQPRELAGRGKRVVVLFQGGPNDREVLKLARRFAQQDDVHLDVFVAQQSKFATLQDLEAMACFESTIFKSNSSSSLTSQGEAPLSLGSNPAAGTNVLNGVTNGSAMRPSVTVHRLQEPQFVSGVMACCKANSPHLIVVGSTEGPEGIVPELQREKRASVLKGAEMNFSKLQMLGKLGQAFASHEIRSSMLVVMCPTSVAAARGAQKSGLEPLGMISSDDDDDDRDELKHGS